jgi:hypothetical protein
MQPSQKLTLVILLMLTLVWLLMAFIDVSNRPILIWALRRLNYSSLYFFGLYIYYREKRMSNTP